ncbi:MAG: hypothetical protein KF745_12075 [Phycisphaeraceae bacterium]|nr:hypothetical protein [Phycisphaeraceae bacterium]
MTVKSVGLLGESGNTPAWVFAVAGTVDPSGVRYATGGTTFIHTQFDVPGDSEDPRDYYIMLCTLAENGVAAGEFKPPWLKTTMDNAPVFELESAGSGQPDPIAYFAAGAWGFPIGRTKRLTGSSEGTFFAIQCTRETAGEVDRFVHIYGSDLILYLPDGTQTHSPLKPGTFVEARGTGSGITVSGPYTYSPSENANIYYMVDTLKKRANAYSGLPQCP